jgi:hypothetical protein
MQRFVRVLALASALGCSSPLLAQELSVSAVKAFTAKIDAAIASCNVDTIVAHVAELAVLTLNRNEQSGTRTVRLNKGQYRQLLTAACTASESYEYDRTNEKISIDGDQAIITADVTEKIVIQGRTLETKTRERATVESIDGKLMLTQLVANQVL